MKIHKYSHLNFHNVVAPPPSKKSKKVLSLIMPVFDIIFTKQTYHENIQITLVKATYF